MTLLGLPAGVRLQIWNRYLVLRGTANIGHGDTCPSLCAQRLGTASLRKRYVTTENDPRRDAAPEEHAPILGMSTHRAMLSKKASTIAPQERKPLGGGRLTPASFPGAAKPADGLYDLQYMQQHLEIPTSAQYPNAPAELFDPDQSHSAVRKACKQQLGIDVAGTVSVRYRIGGPNLSPEHGFQRTLTIPSLITVSAIGEGNTKQAARRAVITHLLAKLHAEGILHKLFPASAPEAPLPPETTVAPETTVVPEKTVVPETPLVIETSPTPETPLAPDTPPVLDAEQMLNQIVSPLKGEYQHAPATLFVVTSIANTVHNAFMQAGIPWKVEGESQNNNHVAGTSLVGYELQVQLPDGINKTTTGHARNKKHAKAVAWARMLKALDALGHLRLLFPIPGQNSQQISTVPTSIPEEAINEQLNDDDDHELVVVDKQTMIEEKDAKVEIYNWAACLGLIPHFQAQTVKRRKAGTRRRINAVQSDVAQASIKLPQLGIEVTRIGATLAAAETAVAVAFKREAEAKQQSGSIQGPQATSPDWQLLSVETASQFFDFYRSIKQGTYLEIEADVVSVAGANRNQARITINDDSVGEPVTMARKKDAEQIARLTAAIAIIRSEPELLGQFAAMIRKGKGKVLRDRPLKASIDGRTLALMRCGLVEARRAGLPDARQSLLPELQTTDDDSIWRRRPPPDGMRRAISKSLLTEHRRAMSDPATVDMRDITASLPMSQYRSQVLRLIAGSLYSIIVGATGSGKTTQVPQIILDEAMWRGEGGWCDVVCTQPRRLAAVSVASRVAAERNSPVGKHVGHQVRFDNKAPKTSGSITYCTTGILLEQLKYDADGIFDTVSHIVIDEVHERSLQIDFLMVLLKRTIKDRRAAGKRVPKVILMSATLDPQLFSRYFADQDGDRMISAPTLTVPGRTFPVQEKYLVDILSDFSSVERTELGLMAEAEKRVTMDYLAAELAFVGGKNAATAPAIDWKREVKEEQSDEERAAAQEKEEALVPLALVATTVAHICKNGDDGAILVFLPGLPEITGVREMLVQNRPSGMTFDDPDKFKICLLHSALPPHEQVDALNPVAQGCRKIILSTTIAETSVTVPDVKYVVDSGKLRQKMYDQVRRITQLKTVWESSSNARQRAGRAGRVQAGHYYALFSRARREAMAPSARPELLLSDLQEICLSVKAQGFNDSVQAFLSEAIEPPSEKAVVGAIENLKAIEALTEDESLTALGRTLSRLPVHPSLGKMVLWGIIFRCLDPMIVLSSLDQDRSLFFSPPGKRQEVKQVLQKYSRDGSDQLAFYEAFKELRAIRAQSGIRGVETHARPNFLHVGSFKSIAATAEQVEKILIECGLVPESASVTRVENQYGGAALNRHSDNPTLIKSLLLAGVQPNLAVKNPGKTKAHRTASEKFVLTHPSSLNYSSAKAYEKKEDLLYAYESLRKTVDGKTMFMKDTTLVQPLQAMLFGGKVKLQAESSKLTLDDWLPFRIENLEPLFAARMVLEFRKALDRMLNGAFNSLRDVREGEGVTIADDPVRDGFVGTMVKVLEQSVEGTRARDSGIWVPPGWVRGKAEEAQVAAAGDD